MVSKEEIFHFQQKFTLEERQSKFKEIESYLDKCVPIIIEESRTSSEDSPAKYNSFLMSKDTTFTLMSKKIKERNIVNPEKAIFFLLNGKIAVSLSTTLSSVYEQYKHEDGFLYVLYSFENVWG
jgi:GABA(A) receptor-associated protein